MNVFNLWALKGVLSSETVPLELLGPDCTSPFLQELISVIITLPITPNKFWGLNKRNSQEKITPPCLVPFRKITQSFTPKDSQGITWCNNFTSITPFLGH